MSVEYPSCALCCARCFVIFQKLMDIWGVVSSPLLEVKSPAQHCSLKAGVTLVLLPGLGNVIEALLKPDLYLETGSLGGRKGHRASATGYSQEGGPK